jgi:ribosomal protein S12 methylthiotransferase accessory factor
MKTEIEGCVAALAGIGLEVFVIDATHPELGVPTVYTIIPGAHFLEHTRDTDFPQHAARTILRGFSGPQIIPHMERLLECFGPRYDLTFFLAHSLELENQPDAALALFQQALQQQPEPREIASIYVHIASCYKDLGNFSKALEALSIAEQHNKDLKEIYNLRGFCYYQLKHHHDAISAFERAIELEPGSAIDYANIGSNLRELGYKEEAIRLYRIALELDPDIGFARDNVLRLEAELGRG